MKVLWFSHVSLLANKKGKFYYPGGNWITSLRDLISKDKNIDLGIVFFGKENLICKDKEGTKYYQIEKKQSNKFKEYLDNWKHTIDKPGDVKSLLRSIEDFDPDVIHIFGTESNLARIIPYSNIPIVIHLQGLIAPYENAWFFPGFSREILIKRMSLKLFIKGYGLFHDHIRFRKMAQREQEYFRTCVNFIGRTHWDKSISKLYSPKSKYFHCDEVLRDSFYNNKWVLTNNTKLIISSTINANIYKGLDLILKTAILLRKYSKTSFEWNVYGINENNEYPKIVEELVNSKFRDNHISLKGVVLEEDLVEGLKNSNLFVHTSYIDNSPNSVCEAQLLGLPVISTNVGGVSSLIDNGINGFLVPANEPDILACKILEINIDKNKLNSISEKGREVAMQRHDRNKIISDLKEIYEKIQ